MGERFDVEKVRALFPGLERRVNGVPAVFLDGPAGSQVPRSVAEAVSGYLLGSNANGGGVFATSVATDALFDDARAVVADFLGTSDPDSVVFGPNMTSLTFTLARSLANTWTPEDEVVVCRTEHDANFTPWVLYAEAVGATVRVVEVNTHDGTLDLESLEGALSHRTRLVAVGCAGNALGSVNPVGAIVSRVRDASDAFVFLDAVHYAPHRLIEVERWGCDFLACSAYKFFGPHIGILWGRRELMEQLPVDKLRPPKDVPPGRWMTGTPSYEGIAGTRAAVEYLAELGRSVSGSASLGRRDAITAAYRAIGAYETALTQRLLTGLTKLPSFRVHGVTDPERTEDRVATISFTHARLSPRQISEALAARGIFVWDGNFYALPITEALGLEPDGVVRVGLLHYNTEAEVDRLLTALAEITA